MKRVTTPVASVLTVGGLIRSMKFIFLPLAVMVKGLPSFCSTLLITYDLPRWLSP